MVNETTIDERQMFKDNFFRTYNINYPISEMFLKDLTSEKNS